MYRLFLILILISMMVLSACSDKQKVETLTQENSKLSSELATLKQDLAKSQQASKELEVLANKLKGIHAKIFTNMGTIEVEFYPEKAPITCFAFITRAESGFYNGTQFHRVIPGFMIQGGDPNSKNKDMMDDGMGGPIANIPHEFNDIKHVPGILSMARTANIGAGAGSQFFIMHGDAPHLNNQYTAFGKVTAGMDVVNKIATSPTFGKTKGQLADHPVKAVKIEYIEVSR